MGKEEFWDLTPCLMDALIRQRDLSGRQAQYATAILSSMYYNAHKDKTGRKMSVGEFFGYGKVEEQHDSPEMMKSMLRGLR